MSNRTLIQGKYFRVHAISKVNRIDKDGPTFEALPFSAGLGIEKAIDNGDHYIVVAFVKPGKGYPNYEDIGFRTVDEVMTMEPEAMAEFKSFVELAREYIIAGGEHSDD